MVIPTLTLSEAKGKRRNPYPAGKEYEPPVSRGQEATMDLALLKSSIFNFP